MNAEEIEVHVEMKKTFESYPTLPKAVYVEEKSGLKESVIRGFRKRLANWQVDHQPSLIVEL